MEAANSSTQIILALSAGFVAGLIFASIIFLVFGNKKPRIAQTGNFASEESNTVLTGTAVKFCPNCNSTYTDETLSYCLRDGTLLKIVGAPPGAQRVRSQ